MEVKNKDIPLGKVESSQIEAIGYDASSETLAIQFKGKDPEKPGSTYHYFAFPPGNWEAFKAAESIGSHFYKHIKGKFEYVKLPETTAAA